MCAGILRHNTSLARLNAARHPSLFHAFVFSGMFAIRAERDYVVDEDFMKAVRKVSDNKKLESKLDYKPL